MTYNSHNLILLADIVTVIHVAETILNYLFFEFDSYWEVKVIFFLTKWAEFIFLSHEMCEE